MLVHLQTVLSERHETALLHGHDVLLLSPEQQLLQGCCVYSQRPGGQRAQQQCTGQLQVLVYLHTVLSETGSSHGHDVLLLRPKQQQLQGCCVYSQRPGGQRAQQQCTGQLQVLVHLHSARSVCWETAWLHV